jgi:hypothetical protein
MKFGITCRLKDLHDILGTKVGLPDAGSGSSCALQVLGAAYSVFPGLSRNEAIRL